MADQIVITEKSSQAKDVRAVVGSRYGEILPAEGHLFDLLEPGDVVPAWKRWSPILLRPEGLYGTRPAEGGNKAAKLRAIREALRTARRVWLATDCDREGQLIGKELVVDGFVLRYRTRTGVDGLPPGEGVFLPCSFWLADNYTLQNRDAEASALFERLLSLRNDVGLLAEEYDLQARRQVGNFPQAFSHLALIGTALSLHDIGPAQQRGRGAKSGS
jgi:hypothetical protein